MNETGRELNELALLYLLADRSGAGAIKSAAFQYHVCTMGILFLALIRGVGRSDDPMTLPWPRLQAWPDCGRDCDR